MTTLMQLSIKSFLHRKLSVGLIIFSIAISVTLLLGVESIRQEAKNSFVNSISGTDLVVGARTGQLPLLLSSVFRIGNPSNNIDWQHYQHIADLPQVQWSIPIALGDSHKQFSVLATTNAYFEHFQYANKQPLTFAQGERFVDSKDVILGAEVAKTLGYTLGDGIAIGHGGKHTKFSEHKDTDLFVSGILAPTGTPVDRTVHITLLAMDHMHKPVSRGFSSASRNQAQQHTDSHEHGHEHSSQASDTGLDDAQAPISAVFVGLSSRIAILQTQRYINEYQGQPLQAVVPRVALGELWRTMANFEKILLSISGFVVAAGLIGMLTNVLSTLNERRREMAVLRAVGARPGHILALFVIEGLLLTLAGLGLGIAMLYATLLALQPIVAHHFGIHLAMSGLSIWQWQLCAIILLAGIVLSLIPGIMAFRQSLHDGLTVKL